MYQHQLQLAVAPKAVDDLIISMGCHAQLTTGQAEVVPAHPDPEDNYLLGSRPSPYVNPLPTDQASSSQDIISYPCQSPAEPPPEPQPDR